jgi:predicted nucleic acid-binding protein
VSFVVVDASVWVARLVPTDVFHEQVKYWLDDQRRHGVEYISPSLLLPEVGGAISRRTETPNLGKQAVTSLQYLPGLRMVEMDDNLVSLAARLASDLGLRGADSLYVAVAYRLGLPLATIDEDQIKRASKVVSIQEITDQTGPSK